MHKNEESRLAIDRIFHLISSGQLKQAKQQCDSSLEHHPRDVNILGLHGAVLLKLGRRKDAQKSLEKAISIEPRFARPHEDLGRLHLLSNKPELAARYFQTAIRLDDRLASAYEGLASALAQLGKTDQAKAAHQQFLERSPIARRLNEAEKMLGEGDLPGARSLCERLLKREPENTRILQLQARIASVDGRTGIAEKLLRQITHISPDEYLPHRDLARFLVQQGRLAEAIEMIEHAISLNDSDPESFRLLGDTLAVIGRSEDALASYQKALDLDPAEPHALAGRGHMLRVIGRKNEAIASYEQCTAHRADFGVAWWNLASLDGYRMSERQLGSIRKQLNSGKVGLESEAGMRFALARSAEVNGDYEAAWKDYGLGNSLKRRLVNFDMSQTKSLHDEIISLFTREFLDSRTQGRASEQTPVFIVGMPRSGSTMLEQILASHSKIEGLGELPYIIMLSSTLGKQQAGGVRYPGVMRELSGEQLDSLGKAYLYHSRIHRKLELPFFTDKMPANFAHIGLIHMMLPNAKIIDARRHPLATCVANYRQLYARGKNYTYDLAECAGFLLEYRKMMEHWQTVLPGTVLTVHYEDVVTDLEGQARRMLEFCGLPWEDACLDFHLNDRPVSSASVEQVREPVYTHALDFWKHYESQLEAVRKILTPVLTPAPG